MAHVIRRDELYSFRGEAVWSIIYNNKESLRWTDLIPIMDVFQWKGIDTFREYAEEKKLFEELELIATDEIEYDNSEVKLPRFAPSRFKAVAEKATKVLDERKRSNPEDINVMSLRSSINCYLDPPEDYYAPPYDYWEDQAKRWPTTDF